MALRSPLGYPGGKYSALPQILPLIPEGIQDWRECFFGGGSVTLGFMQSNKCKAKTFTVCELAPEVWAFWQGTKLHAPEVKEQVKQWMREKMPLQARANEMMGAGGEMDSQKVYDEAIQQGRELWEWAANIDCSNLSLIERAARFYIVNKISFSAMGDSGTLSKDRFMAFRETQTDRLVQIQPLLKNIDIRNVSFEEMFYDGDKEKTFMFLDPPYIAQEGSGLYGRKGDTHKKFPHELLAKMCREANFRWLMTIDDSIKARRLYRGMELKEFNLTYTMALENSKDALAGEELFIANYSIDDDYTYDDIASIV